MIETTAQTTAETDGAVLADDQRLNSDSWISFLNSDVLRPEDELGRVPGRDRPLDKARYLRVCRWRQGAQGPTVAAAREFLAGEDVDLGEYIRWCRDFFAQPWEGQNLGIEWFARW